MFQRQPAQTTVEKAPGAVSSSDDSAVLDALKAIVQRHQVCYEVWPEWSGRGDRARCIGYCVSICGVRDQPNCVRGHHVPGCPHCGLTYTEIRKIAEWITLKDQPDCRFQIEPFDGAWHIAPRERRSRNEIIVTVKILHSHNVDSPVNDSQERCLNKLRAELKKLGVRDGVWRTAKAAAAH